MADEAEGSKSLVLQLYGKDLGPKLAYAAGYGRGYDYRKVLEPTDATAQCENTGHGYTPGMLCYMCGTPIPSKDTMQAKKAADELWPECEHILPLTEGRWLLDIYMTNRLQTDPWTVKARQLEYDQAHRVCNQAKRIQSYIVVEGGRASASRTAVRSILADVVKRAKTNITKGDRRPEMAAIAGMNLDARTSEVVARVQGLVDHINTAPFKREGEEGLVVLMQTALFVDPKTLVAPAQAIHDAWYKDAGARQETYTRNLTTFIQETFLAYPTLQAGELMPYLQTLLVWSNAPLPLEDPEELRLEMERGFVASVTPPIENILKRIYDAKATAETPVDPSGAQFLSLILYGVYRELLTQLQAAGDARSLRLRCDLHARMTRIATLPGPLDAKLRPTAPLEPRADVVFGPPPPLSDADLKACKANAATALRDTRHFLSAAEDEEGEGTIDSLVENILYGLDQGLDVMSARIGVPIGDKTLLLAYAKRCILTYFQVLPAQNPYAAQLIGAQAIAEKRETQLILLRVGLTSDEFRDMLLSESSPYARQHAGRRRRRKTYRKTSKRRKTLRKKVRARVVPKHNMPLTKL
jgi:hypothetical protein